MSTMSSASIGRRPQESAGHTMPDPRTRTSNLVPRAWRALLCAHWPEYLIEATGLGLFMVSACLFTALLEYPGSPIRQALTEPWVRRALIGLAMGLTAIALIYSPWGKRSGAHLNPAVTLTFWRLHKVPTRDALFYILAQCIGAVAGVMLSLVLLGTSVLADPSVNYVLTQPGPAGVLPAFAGELLISVGMMLTVLTVSNRPAINRYTGILAGALVAIYITVEAPWSGMSMNPARSLGSALPAQVWSDLWIYFLAPPLGMLLAAEVYLRLHGAAAVLCCKLHHDNDQPCPFNCRFHA
jgi:aquaporin Z